MINEIEARSKDNLDERHIAIRKLQDLLWNELNKSLYIKVI
jgi:hypothetical protein